MVVLYMAPEKQENQRAGTAHIGIDILTGQGVSGVWPRPLPLHQPHCRGQPGLAESAGCDQDFPPDPCWRAFPPSLGACPVSLPCAAAWSTWLEPCFSDCCSLPCLLDELPAPAWLERALAGLLLDDIWDSSVVTGHCCGQLPFYVGSHCDSVGKQPIDRRTGSSAPLVRGAVAANERIGSAPEPNGNDGFKVRARHQPQR